MVFIVLFFVLFFLILYVSFEFVFIVCMCLLFARASRAFFVRVVIFVGDCGIKLFVGFLIVCLLLKNDIVVVVLCFEILFRVMVIGVWLGVMSEVLRNLLLRLMFMMVLCVFVYSVYSVYSVMESVVRIFVCIVVWWVCGV